MKEIVGDSLRTSIHPSRTGQAVFIPFWVHTYCIRRLESSFQQSEMTRHLFRIQAGTAMLQRLDNIFRHHTFGHS